MAIEQTEPTNEKRIIGVAKNLYAGCVVPGFGPAIMIKHDTRHNPETKQDEEVVKLFGYGKRESDWIPADTEFDFGEYPKRTVPNTTGMTDDYAKSEKIFWSGVSYEIDIHKIVTGRYKKINPLPAPDIPLVREK